MKVNMSYYKMLVCKNGICTIDGNEFVNSIDVSNIINECDITGDIARINHSLESAIDLSYKLYSKTIELQRTIDTLNETILELVEKDYLLLTGEVL